MDDAVAEPAAVTPERITRLLRDAGRLPAGHVVAIRVRQEPSYTSTIARLTLSYSESCPPGMPERLLLKSSRNDPQQRVVGREQRRREVLFHSAVAPKMPDPPLVRCYHASYDEESGASELLFDDVSATHFQAEPSSPPSFRHMASAVEALADLHAFWWDNPELGAVDDLPDRKSVDEHVALTRETYPRFAAAAGDELTAEARDRFRRALDALPRLWERVTQRRNLTLIHGDLNLSNVLLPRDPDAARGLIIDWQLWGVSFAAEDLSHLMALYWSHEQRHEMERDLLRRYHERLVRRVRGWSWTDVWNDYRLAVILRVLFMPMWFWTAGASASEWKASLERAMHAFDDLACQELLDR